VACRSVRAWIIFLAVATLAGGVDLASKNVVFGRLLSAPATQQRLADILANPAVRIRQDEQFTRAVLREVHARRRVCFGLSLTLSTNPGVVFGFSAIPRWAVNLMTIAMILAVLGFFLFSPSKASGLHIALALILGGAIGNLYDRLFSAVTLGTLTPIRYHVRDFIDCSDLGYNYIFNAADAWLVIGVAMLVIYWLGSGKKQAGK
jgi:signal peptidase II